MQCAFYVRENQLQNHKIMEMLKKGKVNKNSLCFGYIKIYFLKCIFEFILAVDL